MRAVHLLQCGLYALLAAGLSLMFGVMRIVNLAHGALAVMAAYVGLVIVQGTGVSPFLAIVAVVPIMADVPATMRSDSPIRSMSACIILRHPSVLGQPPGTCGQYGSIP